MKKYIKLLAFLAVAGLSLPVYAGSSEPVEKSNETKKAQGEGVLEGGVVADDSCSPADLIAGHGGVDCSSVRVFDFDDRSAKPAKSGGAGHTSSGASTTKGAQ